MDVCGLGGRCCCCCCCWWWWWWWCCLISYATHDADRRLTVALLVTSTASECVCVCAPENSHGLQTVALTRPRCIGQRPFLSLRRLSARLFPSSTWRSSCPFRLDSALCIGRTRRHAMQRCSYIVRRVHLVNSTSRSDSLTVSQTDRL
jgi:hypothetical protein